MKGQKKSPFPLLRVLAGFVVVLSMAIAYGCGSGGGGESGATPATIIGTFWDAEVDGITYNANPSGQTGTTQNAGKFVCKADDTVGFFVGDVFLGQTTCKKNVTLLDLVPGATDETNPVVTNIARFLQSLDSDLDPSNGININSDTVAEVMGRPIDIVNPELSFDNDADLQALFIMLGVTPVTSNEARDHFRTTLLDFLGDNSGRGDPDGDSFPGNQDDSNDTDDSITPCAAVYIVTPSMTPAEAISTIESAVDGDTVEIAPGLYQFRVNLEKPGVTVMGQDPANRPVFDYTGQDVNLYPGSILTTHWKASYAWIIQGDNVIVKDIVIKGARIANRAARGMYIGPDGIVNEPATAGSMPGNVVVRRVDISDCDNGLDSAALGLLIDDSNIHGNGIPNITTGRNNIYIQGGSFTIQNSSITHALSGQNFNIRAKDGIIDNCVLGDMNSYPVLLNTPKATMTNGVPQTQTLIIRNSTISGVRHTGLGLSKAFSLENGSNYVGLTQNIELYNNTFTGRPGATGSIVALYRKSGHAGFGVKSKGNTYTNYGTFLRLNPPSEDVNDPFYTIDVQDVQDASLPAPSGPGT